MITRFFLYAQNINILLDGTIHEVKHIVLKADSTTNDTHTLIEMLKQDDVQEFMQAMVKKVQDHEIH